MEKSQCCAVDCERPLDQTYWDNQYKSNVTGWDLGIISPPIKAYFDTLENINATILIPGCGNTYEAEYLLKQGFKNITVIDIAPSLVETLKQKFINQPNIRVIVGDFFEHQGKYDYIIEQTFFCALPPKMRQKYVFKMHQLLNQNGILIGLLFNRTFEVSPPFGGSNEEYELLFRESFIFNTIKNCQNSIEKRANSELFIEFRKNEKIIVKLYNFQGITCTGCKNTITEKFRSIEGVKNVSMNTAFSEVLVVSESEIKIEYLQKAISYDSKYKIKEMTK